MSELADRGAHVLYVDNLGLRGPRLGDLDRVLRRVTRWVTSSLQAERDVRRGIRRDTPILPPGHHWPLLRGISARMLFRRISRRVPAGAPVVVWTYSPAPVIRAVANRIGADLVVFDWADDASKRLRFASDRQRARVERWERETVDRADVVFVASADLLANRRPTNPRTHLVPHGAPPRVGPEVAAPELLDKPRPIIGFVGTLSELTDIDVLEEMARARPAWTFALVGPLRTRAPGLTALPNVVMMGPRPYDQILSLVYSFDVGLIPYRVTPGTTVASPLKLTEYVAAGVPIVSADLPDVRRRAPWARIASGTDQYLAAVEDALREPPPPPLPFPTWAERVDEMLTHLQDALGKQIPSTARVPGPLPGR